MEVFQRAKQKQSVSAEITKYKNGRWMKKLGRVDPTQQQKRDNSPPKKNRP